MDTHITVLDLAWGQINTSLLPQNMQSPCQTPQNPTISSLVPFDVVLGSDLVYDAANHRSLVHTLLATTNQRSRILLSCRHRPCWDPEGINAKYTKVLFISSVNCASTTFQLLSCANKDQRDKTLILLCLLFVISFKIVI